jgi:hypothetical protein
MGNGIGEINSDLFSKLMFGLNIYGCNHEKAVRATGYKGVIVG